MGTRGGIFEGWYVVAAVFVVLMVNAGFGFYGLAVYLEAITEEQGFSTASVSLATSIFFVISALTGRVIAPVIQRRDLRVIIAIGAVVSAIGMFLVGRSTSLTTLYPSYVVMAVGFGLSGLVPATTLVTRWFHVKRSIALSIASTGLSVGGLTFAVLAATLIDRRGMPSAMPVLAIVCLLVVSLAAVAMWPDPAARGQMPDGVEATPAQAAALVGEDYDTAIRSTFFVLATVGFIFAMASQVGGIAQLAKLGSERVDDGTGTLLVSTVAASSVIARLIGGVVASRVRLIVMTGTLSIIQGVALVLMSVGETRLWLVLSTVLFGCTIGNLLMLQPLVLADRFGVANYPKIFSLSQLIVTGLGVAGGPYLLGWLHDASSYRLSYFVAAVSSVLGGLVFLTAWYLDRANVSAKEELVLASTSQANVRSA